MDAVSYSLASKQAQRIEKFIENPDSMSGIVTVPKVIASGETITIPAGRIAVLPNVQVDGVINVEGEVFVPSGSTYGDLDTQIALKADTSYVNSKYSGFKNYIINGKKVVNQRALTSTDNSYNQDRWYKAGNNWFQGIEGDNNLISGKKYTLSWVGSATASYYVGTATSATINAQSFTSIANGGNFTLSISAGQNLWIKFATDSTGSTFNFVQLEEGSIATPFEQRPYGLELSLCRRYCTQAGAGATGIEESASSVSFGIKFDTPMRTPPTIVVNPTVSWRVAGADRLNMSVSVEGGGTVISDSSIWLYLIDNSNDSVAGRPIINRLAANFIIASAEL